MTETVFIDHFSSGLDELPKRRQRSTRDVLAALSGMKRVSIFEVTDNDVIAATVDRIAARGLATITPSNFPWSDVEVTEAGKSYLAGKGRTK